MRKSKGYVFACLLTGLLLTGSLAGCGSGEDANEKEDSTELVETSAKAGKEETEAVDDAETEKVEKKKYEKITSDAAITDYDSVVVVDKSAYELYTYRQDTAASYTSAVNQLAKELDGKAQIYNILVPLSSEVTFPDNLRDQIASTDQKEAIDKTFAQIDEPVKKVDIYDSLMSHRTEYIYFRTDHHWTALGAYYAYEDFCEAKGIEPEKLSDYDTVEFDGFVGSFYNDTGDKVLKDNPDTLVAYEPKCDTEVEVTASDGTVYNWLVIYDVSSYGADLKYSTFVAGDNPMTVIENKDLNDGSSCVVVKESFGNAFIPFLVDHYQTIYVIDYRYYKGTLSGLIAEKDVDDILLINNLSMLRNQYLVGQFQSVVK